RDSYSSEDSIEEDINANVLADIKAYAMFDAGIGIEVAVKVVSEDEEEYEAESSARGIAEIRMDRVIKSVVADDIAKPTSENYHDLVNVDGSREDMKMELMWPCMSYMTICMRFPLKGLRISRHDKDS
ncbi:hypothetical protein Tco_1189335, partial [Tanacetum coccineum]